MAEPVQIAIEHQRAGRFAEAETVCRQLLARSPRDPHVMHVLGTVLLQRGNLPEAITHLKTVTTLAPGVPPTWFALAQALRLSGKFTEAEAAATRAIALRPDFPPSHNELGLALVNQGKAEPAMAAWRRAIQLKGDYAEALCNLGASLAQSERFNEAVPLLQTAARLMPNHPPAHNNLANVLDELGRTDEAIAHWRRAIELDPNFFDPLLNFGKSMQKLGRNDEASALLERALVLRPNDPQARFLRGLLLLVRGQLREGFAEYEFRLANPHFNLAARTFDKPRWDPRGGGDVAGKTILLHAEQGLGDTIQFARYAPLLAERGATVILESPPELTDLLRTMPKVQQVIPRGEPLPPFDLHASVVSLPLLFGTTLETIPANVPYISVPPDREAKWAQIAGPRSGKPRVGLVWAGNPQHSNDVRRSVALRELAPALAEVPDVECFSLQKGPAAAQLHEPGLGLSVIDHTAELRDFADTAALVSQLDLVIAVDTSVAHVAGALGKRVALLLAYVPDWRWLLGRDDSPWYPTMKLYRQLQMGDWTSVADRVAREAREARAARVARELR